MFNKRNLNLLMGMAINEYQYFTSNKLTSKYANSALKNSGAKNGDKKVQDKGQ